MRPVTVLCDGSQEINGRDIEWDAQVRISYAPAKLYGPPENCHPDESEADIEALTTWPEGFEDRIHEDDVIERAWEQFHIDQAENRRRR